MSFTLQSLSLLRTVSRAFMLVAILFVVTTAVFAQSEHAAAVPAPSEPQAASDSGVPASSGTYVAPTLEIERRASFGMATGTALPPTVVENATEPDHSLF